MSILDRILKYINAQRSRTTPVSTAPPQQQSTPIRNGTTFSFDEFEAPPPKKRVFASVVPDGFTAVLQIIEIAATIILAAASFFVAFQANTIAETSNNIADKQSKIADQQLELECALSKPMLSVEPIYGDYNSTIDQIIFTNSGGPAEDFQIQVFPCFRFYFSGVESSPEETIRFEQHDLITFVPIHNGNFPICYVTNVNSTYGSVGSVITTPYISQCHAVMDSASNRHGLYQTVSLEYFIIVSYQDIYKADYEQYYHCVTGHYSDSPDAHIKGLPLPRFTSLSPDDELHDYLKSLSEENDIQMYYPIWNNNIDEEVDSIFNILKETTYGWAID